MTALVLVALVGCGPKILPGPAPITEAQAPVQLIERQDLSSPNIYLQVMVEVGSADDPIGQEGLAHLTAASMVEAGAGARNGQQLKESLYPTGNAIEWQVDREWTSFRLSCHRDQAQLCIDILGDVLVSPGFGESDVDRVREQAVYQITDGLLSDEEALAQEVLNDWIYEAHPYGHPVPGRAGVLSLITPYHLKSFHQNYFVHQNILVGIAGNYDESLKTSLETRLNQLPTSMPPQRALQQPMSINGRHLLAVDTDTPVTGFALAHPIELDRNHPDWPALYLAFIAFGEHRQSHGRLFRILRTERGLNYGDYAYMEPFVQRGSSSMPEQGVLRSQATLSLWLRPTGVENGPFALKLALDEFERFAAVGLTQQEFEDIRTYALGRLPLLATDPGRRLAYAMDARATHTANPLELLPGVLPALTLEQVNAAIQRHVHPENLKIVAVSGEATQLVQALTEEKPTPIVYAAGIEVSPAQQERDAVTAQKSLLISKDNAKMVPAKGIFQ